MRILAQQPNSHLVVVLRGGEALPRSAIEHEAGVEQSEHTLVLQHVKVVPALGVQRPRQRIVVVVQVAIEKLACKVSEHADAHWCMYGTRTCEYSRVQRQQPTRPACSSTS